MVLGIASKTVSQRGCLLQAHRSFQAPESNSLKNGEEVGGVGKERFRGNGPVKCGRGGKDWRSRAVGLFEKIFLSTKTTIKLLQNTQKTMVGSVLRGGSAWDLRSDVGDSRDGGGGGRRMNLLLAISWDSFYGLRAGR